MKFIDIEPNGQIYKKLIEYSIETCDTFMFFICNYEQIDNYREKMSCFLAMLKPLLKKTRHNGVKVTCWPGSKSWDNRFERDIMFYRSDKSAIETLLRPTGLYQWQYPDYPEDICFFRNGYCWLTTSAHEGLAYIITNDKSEYNKLESIGVVFKQKEYEDTPSIFFEEY